LVFTASAGYKFSSSQFGGIFSDIYYDDGIFFAPPVGAGTITILNWTLSNNNANLTVNLKLDQVPLTGYLTTQGYTIGPYVVSTTPKIIDAPLGYTISGPGGTGSLSYTSKDITVENFTGSDIFLWVGVNQFSTGPSGNSTLYYNGYFAYFPYVDLQCNNVPVTNGQYYSNYYTLPTSSTITGYIFRGATSDTAHTVQLWYSFTPTGTKYMLTT
jgi:hypothetical protein